MRLLLAHDHRFVRTAEGLASRQFSGDVLRRYRSVFDEIVLLGRAVDAPSGMARGEAPPPLDDDGVSVVVLENLSSAASWFGARKRAAATMVSLVKWADAIVVRLPSEIGLLTAAVASQLGRRFAVELVGCSLDSLSHHGTAIARAYAPIQFLRTRLAVSRATHINYVTSAYLQRRYPPKMSAQIESISDVALADFDPSILGRRLERIKQHSGRVRVGLIGTLETEYKGVDTAIKVVSRLADAGCSVELHVVGGGDGSRYTRLAHQLGVTNRVSLEGSMSRDEVFDWLDEIDVYVQPSRTEGLPRALIEAMSRACPSIGSDVGGIPELLPRSCLFGPRDVCRFASLLRMRAESQEIQIADAIRNYGRAQEYRAERLDERRVSFLRSILSIQ